MVAPAVPKSLGFKIIYPAWSWAIFDYAQLFWVEPRTRRQRKSAINLSIVVYLNIINDYFNSRLYNIGLFSGKKSALKTIFLKRNIVITAHHTIFKVYWGKIGDIFLNWNKMAYNCQKIKNIEMSVLSLILYWWITNTNL